MSKAIVYTRFSPQRNADESDNCALQEHTCREYAEAHGHQVLDVLNDKDVSGKDEYREKLWLAIEALPRGGVLIVFKRDRLARNVFLAEQINRAVESRGATIEAVSGDVAGNGPEQVMIRQVLAAIAEYERKLIALRTSWAMSAHQKSGKLMSRYAPYGYSIDPVTAADKDVDTMLLPVESEQEAIQLIRVLHEKGMNPHSIMIGLNSKMPGRARSGKWNQKLVSNIIRRL